MQALAESLRVGFMMSGKEALDPQLSDVISMVHFLVYELNTRVPSK